MLTNSKKYHELKQKIASFLNINIDQIRSICNPLRNKKIKNVWLVSIESSKAVIIREKEGELIILK